MNINLRPIPPLWEQIRREVQRKAGAYDVVIAGGAIRDHLLGFEPGDLDCFILGINPVDAKRLFGVEAFEYIDGCERLHITLRDQDVDLVFAHTSHSARDVLDGFDVGICKAAWDGQSLILDEHFLRDAAQGQMSGAANYRGTHVARLREKFAGRLRDEITYDIPF